MSDVIIVALIATVPGILATVMAWRGQQQARIAAHRVSTLEIKMDGYMVTILESTEKAASAAATAAEREIAASRAAEAALAVAKVVASKAEIDQAAAEGRTP